MSQYWISLKDSQPELGDTVLMLDKKYGPEIRKINFDPFEHTYYTHWAPLPKHSPQSEPTK